MNVKYVLGLVAVIVIALGWSTWESPKPEVPAIEVSTNAVPSASSGQPLTSEQPMLTSRRVDFSLLNSAYRFSADVSSGFEIEKIAGLSAINIYDAQSRGSSLLEQSQVFIRFFEANDFLTLSTVTVLDRKQTTVRGHAAVRYEIEKKSGVPPFADQPRWRSGRHDLIDIRLRNASPSHFYVVARNPEFPKEEFERLIESIQFHNDPEQFVVPIDRATERIIKKPFGLFVEPGNSPVEPERFRGHHTAVDFETFPEEANAPVTITAVCGGEILRRQQARDYGGTVVQSCERGNEALTIIYGHLDVRTIKAAVGQYLSPWQPIGQLAAAETPQSGDERKHLHLGIHRGTTIDLRGYVLEERELSEWIDPLRYLGRIRY